MDMSDLKEKAIESLDKLAAYAKMERFVAVACMIMPLILWWADAEPGLRESISDYVYMEPNAHVFGIMLTIAAMLFISNGFINIKAVYRGKTELMRHFYPEYLASESVDDDRAAQKLSVKSSEKLRNRVQKMQEEKFSRSKRHGRWYNIVLGLALLGVAVFPHEDYFFWHYLFAIIFFVGSALVIAIFNEKRHRKISIVIAILSVIALAAHFVFPQWISLLGAEWVSLCVIGTHYILESSKSLS
jgi:hypothetical protein